MAKGLFLRPFRVFEQKFVVDPTGIETDNRHPQPSRGCGGLQGSRPNPEGLIVDDGCRWLTLPEGGLATNWTQTDTRKLS